MIGNIVRTVGILGLLFQGNIQGAAICVIALVAGSLFDKESVIRWLLGMGVLAVGLWIIFSINYVLGIIVVIICFIAALSPTMAD